MNVSNGLADDTAPMRVLTQHKPESPMLSQHSCFRCGRAWWPRCLRKPKRCPRCKSPYWDRPRQVKEPRTPATFEALRTALQEKVHRKLGIELPDQPRQDRSLVKALTVLKGMKAAGQTWQEMAQRVEQEFGARLDKEQLKALVR
jgi:hypothetical protein